jgi:hypothetical protein
MSAPDDGYAALAATGPLEVGVGSMLLNIADPLPGMEQTYNRWYEDDHFFTGALMSPWVFAGRRWLATAELRSLQYGRPGGEFDPPGSGCYAGTYWIAPGRLLDYRAWASGVGSRPDAESRSFTERRLVFTTFADHRGSVRRDERVPPDVYALMDPHGGLVVQLIDVPSADQREEAIAKLLEEFLPSRLAESGTTARSAMLFQGAESVGMRPALQELQRRSDNDGRRIVVVWFLDADPRIGWARDFAPLPELVDAHAIGVVEWMAPFIPSHMGTDDYTEQVSLSL